MRVTVNSRNNVPIRLTNKQWFHIVEGHEELVGMRNEVHQTVGEAHSVLEGHRGELLAIKERGQGRWLVVVYRELKDDGFIITAFLTSKESALFRRKQLWP